MANRNKPLFLFLSLCLISLTSCLGPHKVNKWVAKHYAESPVPAFGKPGAGIKMISPLSTSDPALSVTEKSSRVLPLLFYWKWNIDNHCTLNPAIPLGFFSNGVLAEARTVRLKEKLAGKTVDVSIEQVPRLMNVNDNGWLAWIILFYVGGESISVGPEDGDLKVNWHFTENGVAGEAHQFAVSQEARPLFVRYFQSTRKTSWRSLKAYDERIEKLGRQFTDEIVQELGRTKSPAN